MILWLIWIETLLAALLLVACAAAVASILPRRWMRGWAVAALASLPLLMLTFTAVVAGLVKFAMALQQNYFAYATGLWIAFVLGSIAILLAAFRRRAGMAPAARSWPRARLALALLAVFAVIVMTVWNADLSIRADAQTIKALAGTTFLSLVPPAPPDSLNAAVLYDQVIQRLQGDPYTSQLDADSADPQALQFLKRHTQSVALLRRAAAMPYCRFDRDWARPDIRLMLPELGWMRDVANLLQLDARSRIASGDTAAALADVTAINAMARHIGAEPILISGLVSFAIESAVRQPLESILAKSTPGSQLPDPQRFDPLANRRIFSRCLRGEECFGMNTFAELESGDVSVQSLDEIVRTSRANHSNLTRYQFPAPLSLLTRLYFLSSGLDAYQSRMERYQNLADKPYARIKDTLTAISDPDAPAKSFFDKIFTFRLDRAFRAQAMTEAADASAQLAIAAAHYRLDHRALPTSLQDLIPDYLPAVPADPFSAQPMRLITTADRWTVYSIGPDAIDDGGAPLIMNPPRSSDPTGDIAISLPTTPP